jgi:hypothetical protein
MAMIAFVTTVFLSFGVFVIIGCVFGVFVIIGCVSGMKYRSCTDCGKNTRELFGVEVNNSFYCTECYGKLAIKNDEKSAQNSDNSNSLRGYMPVMWILNNDE